MEKLINANHVWIENVWDKIERKLSITSDFMKEKIPSKTKNGIYDDMMSEKKLSWWTNGFWPGIMWMMYVATKDEKYKATAERIEKALDKPLYHYESLYHDVGFMWQISAGANYKITGSSEAKNRNLVAAAALASRYNTDGGFIRSWNSEKAVGWAIIDCMMNLPILYWASDVIGDPRFRQIAVHHADKAMEHHVRADGSVIHVVEYDINNGEVIGYPHTQGYHAESSSWSRGQAWAIYGFILSYIHTKKQEYLDTAKKIAHYFISAVACEGYVPKCDFRAPDEPIYYDTSAGAIAACGLIEIAKVVPEYEKELYLKAAINILKALEKDHCDWSLENESILLNSMGSYNMGEHTSYIWGDYYFIEALYKLKGYDILFW